MIRDRHRPSITEIIPEGTITRFAKLLIIAVVLYLILYGVGFQKLFINDAEGISALLQIIGTLYSVLYAFATYVIWGQFTAVEDQILKESGALKDLMLFGQRLNPGARDAIMQAVKVYAKGVVDGEWKALAANEPIDKTDRLFRELVVTVTCAKPQDDTERMVYERLLEVTEQASTHRDVRLALSVKRIPRTLLVFVTVTALLILFLLFFYPFRNAALGFVSIAITTMLLFFSYFVVTDLDNPFEGAWNVGPEPFADLVTKFRASDLESAWATHGGGR